MREWIIWGFATFPPAVLWGGFVAGVAAGQLCLVSGAFLIGRAVGRKLGFRTGFFEGRSFQRDCDAVEVQEAITKATQRWEDEHLSGGVDGGFMTKVPKARLN